MSTEDEARNLAPRRGAPTFWTYVALVVAGGGSLLVPQLLGLSGDEIKSLNGARVG